jgi:hypothetical protein
MRNKQVKKKTIHEHKEPNAQKTSQLRVLKEMHPFVYITSLLLNVTPS